MKFNTFKEIPVWILSIQIAQEVYRLTNEGRFSRDFALRDQIRKAIVSVSSNIAEGFERDNNNEFIRFLKISKGSLGEVKSQLYLSTHIGYIDKVSYSLLDNRLIDLDKQLGSFILYLEYKREKKEFLNKRKHN